MFSAKILSVIVLYHPDLVAVKQMIQTLHQQNSAIILVDNSPKNCQATLQEALLSVDQYIHCPENLGLGKAHNVAIHKAIQEHYDFLLVFDQDSSIPAQFIQTLLQTFTEVSAQKKVAAVGPSYIDSRYSGSRRETVHLVQQATEKKMIISSGSLFSVPALADVGLMDEALFIDFVDTEWCYRAHKKGYAVYQSATAIMEHHLGEMKPILGGLYKLAYMKPIRYYYFTRNLKRLTREHRIARSSSILGFMRHIPIMLIKCFFLPGTLTYLKYMWQGIKDK